MARRLYVGKLGEEVRARYLHTAGKCGGTRNFDIICALADLLLWPQARSAASTAWHRDWRIHQAEPARTD